MVEPQRFSAEVLGTGGRGGHAVVVPPAVARQFSAKRPPVLARINGVDYRSRLMVYGGHSYLGLRKDLLRAAEVTAGDQVTVELTEVDEAEHRVATVVEPPELLAALEAHPTAAAAYRALPFTHQQEYARWIAEAKGSDTRVRRIERTISRLADR